MAIKMDSVTKYAEDATQMEFRGKVFSGQGVQIADVRVDEDGTVRVWDDVAGHWTTCHSISARNLRAIRRAAKQS